MRVAGGDLYGVVVKAPTEPAGENAGGDLWGVATKAPTEPAGEKSEPQVCFSFAGVFFFQTKRKCQGSDLMNSDLFSVKDHL